MQTHLEKLEARQKKLDEDREKVAKDILAEKAAIEEAKVMSELFIDVSYQTADAVMAVHADRGFVLPKGMSVDIRWGLAVDKEGNPVQDEEGKQVETLVASILGIEKARKPSGGGGNSGNGGGNVTYDGVTASWNKHCARKSLDVGVRSGHAVFREKLPVEHKTIPHDCCYDHIRYPGGEPLS